jgi:hypothetical protein
VRARARRRDQNFELSSITFHTTRQLKIVTGLQRTDIAQGRDLGVVLCGIAICWTDSRFEFTCVYATTEAASASPTTNGFYFAGPLSSAQRCFREPPQSIEAFVDVVTNSAKSAPANASDGSILLFEAVDGADGKAYWQLASNGEVLGFLPLRRARAFHNVPTKALVSVSDKHAVSIHVATDLDRNDLLPRRAKLDALLSKCLLAAASAAQSQWHYIALPPTSEGDLTDAAVHHVCERIASPDDSTLILLRNVILRTDDGQLPKLMVGLRRVQDRLRVRRVSDCVGQQPNVRTVN